MLIRIAREAILMSTHNIGFYEEISKIIIKYHQICTLFLLLVVFNFGVGFRIMYFSFKGISLETIYFTSYRKLPKFSDAKKLCCNLPKIQTKRPKLTRVFRQKDENGIANSLV